MAGYEGNWIELDALLKSLVRQKWFNRVRPMSLSDCYWVFL